ncbi:hypothetical protein DIPPA_33425 [Diplonema papillatum]|nr:hypothetical protein DIPPA_33425 [Diplonema papillatum]
MAAAVEYQKGFFVKCTDEAILQFIKKVDDDVRAVSNNRETVIMRDLGGLGLFVHEDSRTVLEDRIDAFLRNDPSGQTCSTAAGLRSSKANKLDKS